MVRIEKMFGHFLDYVVVCIVPCRRQRKRPHPVDEAGRFRWRRAPVFASAILGTPQKPAKRKRDKRRERAGAERLRGAVGDPETGWYTVKSFLDTFSRKSITMEGQKMENSHPEKAK